MGGRGGVWTQGLCCGNGRAANCRAKGGWDGGEGWERREGRIEGRGGTEERAKGKWKEQSHLGGRESAVNSVHTGGVGLSHLCADRSAAWCPPPGVHCALTHPRQTRFPNSALQCLWEPPRHPIWDPGWQTCVCLVRLHGAPTMWMSLRPNHWPQTWTPPWPEQASRVPRGAPALAPLPSRLSPRLRGCLGSKRSSESLNATVRRGTAGSQGPRIP